MSTSQDNLLDKAKATIINLFANSVPTEELDAIKNWVKLADMPPATPDANAPAAPKEVKTKDGKLLSIEGEIKVDAPIKESTPDGLVDLADGDYVLVDDAGKELPISVMGGKIAEISTVQEEQKDPAEGEMAKQVATLSTQLSEQKTAHEKMVAELKAELDNTKQQVVTLSNNMVKILETPINIPTNTNEKSWEEMTAFEKWKASKQA